MSIDAPATKKEDQPKGKSTSVWIKLFVLFHCVAITSWSLPPAKDIKPPAFDHSSPVGFAKSVGTTVSDGVLWVNQYYFKQSPVMQYVECTGFWQYWDMFAPNPSAEDRYGTAEIIYQDGKIKEYTYPRIFELPIPVKYLKERYRKFYERASLDSGSYTWPGEAQRIALINFDDPKNPPVEVKLTRHWYDIAPPGQPQPPGYRSYMYFDYMVQVDQLRQDREGQ